MIMYTKEQLIVSFRKIYQIDWHKSVKHTVDTRNDGAVGNTLESLLHIKENNLPIPNTQEWELKGQRSHTTSLVTLKHIEPSPKASHVVSEILLPYYGWPHKQAGLRYPKTEKSFRSTTNTTNYTNRGFIIIVDRPQKKLRFVFNSNKVDNNNPEIALWFKSVKERIGIKPLNPEPYWGFDDLKYDIGSKIKNCFYSIAESKIEEGQEFFHYRDLYILSGFSFEKFLICIEAGKILIDFDARTGHNHGTKFRIRQGFWADLYSEVNKAI